MIHETNAAEARGRAEGKAEARQEMLQALIAVGIPEAQARIMLRMPSH